ncbi:MAG: sigma-54 dependent transcriptional regulator [Nitrospiraceae bacterium]|nr:sigma-54 dependent transcriptional regulator [Nitrospiraceae bacterium]
MINPRRILIIDDDKLFCDVISDYLGADGMEVFTAHTGSDGTAVCSSRRIDVVLLDQNLPDAEGHTLCSAILGANDQTKIIFITAHPSFEGAVKAIKAGAYDYLSKPFELEELSLALSKAVQTQDLEKIAQVEAYRTVKEREETVLIGSKGLSEVNRLADLAAASSAPVLITGETGTGKNVVARAIHFRSPARDAAFISVNCAAIPETLIESELFGHEKGAFTGAAASKKGVFEMAEGGTLLLDEIGSMPLHLQTKLLGVLEDRQVRRLGGGTALPVDARIIAATNTDLEKGLGKTFRSDLFYRLSVVRIHIPPLRERREDIPELCDYLLRKVAAGREIRLSREESDGLMRYDWPGNVRELRNILERACIVQEPGSLRPSELIFRSSRVNHGAATTAAPEGILTMEQLEKEHISRVLADLSGNLTATARTLGLSLSTLKRKIKVYGLK